MKVRHVELFNTPHEDRPACGWRHCRDPRNKARRRAKHHARFIVRSGHGLKAQWHGRLIGLCDQHRGNFKTKFLPSGKRVHGAGVVTSRDE